MYTVCVLLMIVGIGKVQLNVERGVLLEEQTNLSCALDLSLKILTLRAKDNTK